MDNFQLPEGWMIKTLDEVCEIARGGSPRPIKQFLTEAEDGVNWIKIGDATASTKYIYETKQKIKPEGIQRSRLVNEGDFLLSNSMSFGRPYIMKTSGCIHDGWLVLSDKSGEFEQDYLYHFLGSSAAYKQFDNLAAGSTVRNLNIDLVKSVQLPLPPIPEQQRIVTLLDDAFARIVTATAHAEQNLKNARELFDSTLNTLFTEKGEGWVLKQLGDVYDVRDGTHDSPKYQPDGYALITSKNLKKDGLNFEKIKFISESDYLKINERSAVHQGDILFAMIGTIGNPIVVEVEPNFAIKNVALFKIKDGQNSYFLKYYLESPYVQEKMKKEAKGTTQKFVGLGYLRSFPITLPDIIEQQRIVNELNILATQTKHLEAIYQQKLDALAELKQSLLQQAFAGDL